MSQPCLQLKTQMAENNFEIQVGNVFKMKTLSFCSLPAHCAPLEGGSSYTSDLSAVVSPRSWS